VRRLQLLPATAGDAEVLTDLHLDVWDEAYAGLVPVEVLTNRRKTRHQRVERWREIIEGAESTELLAWEDGRLIGFLSCGAGRDEPEDALPALEVRALYVRSDVYDTGVGYALLDAGIGSASAFLWVLEGNLRAIRFYERQGFVFDGCVKTELVGVEHRMVRWSS
jgi:GNAT superfamily N-acetyltransferase